MRTLSLLNGRDTEEMVLPKMYHISEALVDAVEGDLFRIIEIGLDFNVLRVMFRREDFDSFDFRRIMSAPFKGRVVIAFESGGFKGRLLDFIQRFSIDFNESLKGKIETLVRVQGTVEGGQTDMSNRSRRLVELLKEFYGHQCMICKGFILTDTLPYTEAHHMIPLVERGTDTPENIAVICPNCHKKAHYGIWDERKRIWKVFKDTNPFIE